MTLVVMASDGARIAVKSKGRQEVVLQSAVYCGVPAANSAFALLGEVEHALDGGRAVERAPGT